MSTIKISAIVNKIATTVDGGWRVTFDCDASNAEHIMALSYLRDYLVSLEIEVEEDDSRAV